MKLESYIPYALDGVRIIFIFLLAWILTLIARRGIRGFRKYSVRMMIKSGGATEFELEKRAQTISRVAGNAMIFLIWIVAALMAMQKLGFEIGPLLASLGVVGVAVGFGAQSLVKDILAGMFLLLENQIRVNDVAVINGTGGLVEEINLRTTVLRAENGAVHIFPNGGITSLANLTRDYSYYVFEVGVNYREDTDQVTKELQRIGGEVSAEEPYKDAILAPLEIMGVDKLADSAVVVKARFKTLPGKQWLVGREMNRRIKKTFEDAGIDIPFPTRTVHIADGPMPDLREQIRSVLTEVLDERAPAVRSATPPPPGSDRASKR
jgi:small conductance mechanosensitive channel